MFICNAFGVVQKVIHMFLAVRIRNIEYLRDCLALFLQWNAVALWAWGKLCRIQDAHFILWENVRHELYWNKFLALIIPPLARGVVMLLPLRTLVPLSLPRLGLYVLCCMTYVYRVGRHCGGQLCHLPESHNGSLHWVPGKPSIGHKWRVYCCLGCLQCKRLLFLVYLLTPLITWTVWCQIAFFFLLFVNFTFLYIFSDCLQNVYRLTINFEVHLVALAALCWLVVCVTLLLCRLAASMWNQHNMENMSECVLKCVILF